MQYTNIKNHLMTYSEAADQAVYVSAEGARFTDEAGKTYLNLNDISCVLGYGHPEFTRRLSQLVQTQMLGHFGTLSAQKEQLIQNFMEVTRGDFDKILFAGSGGEVVDWAIKAARRCTGRDGIISFDHALHGRSFAGAWISGIPLRKEGFGSGLEHVYFWPSPGDGRPSEPTADTYSDIAAVILEPYQAAGGMASPSAEYWQWLRQYTRDRGILLILDEIQTGFGKTGSFFAYEELGIVPDILLAGKGMSNGFGLGAMLMSREVGLSIRPMEMSGGSADNDLMCGIVNTVFDIYRQEKIPEHAARMGLLFRQELTRMSAQLGIRSRLYGQGLFLALELPEGMARQAAVAAKQRGVVFGVSRNRLMLRPPLIITETDVREAVSVLQEALSQLCTG